MSDRNESEQMQKEARRTNVLRPPFQVVRRFEKASILNGVQNLVFGYVGV